MMNIFAKRAGASMQPIKQLGTAMRQTGNQRHATPCKLGQASSALRPSLRQCGGGQQRVHFSSSAPQPKTRQPFVLRMVDLYKSSLKSRPLTTKAVTSGIIAGVGDCTCQLLEINAADEELDETEVDETEADMGKELRQRAMVVLSDIDWARCARFTVLGAGFIAPSLHTWYGFLARNFSDLSVTTIARRLALDQLVFTPVFLAGFLSMVMLVDGQAAKIVPKLESDYLATLVSNWAYWIPAQLVNFRFVAPAYQVLYSNAMGFVWNIYLSYQANKGVTSDDAQPTESPRSLRSR